MTVQDAYRAALSLDGCDETQDDTLRQHAVEYINIFLSETLPNENAIRASRGFPKLFTAPVLSSITDTIPYDINLVSSAAKFFIAHLQMKSDDDNVWASRFYDMYVSAVAANTPLENIPPLEFWR